MTIQTQTKTISPIRKRLFTVEEYYKMAEAGILQDEERVELLNGEIITMSPINSFHAGTVNILYGMLYAQLNGEAVIICQNPIHLKNRDEPEPDFTIAHFKQNQYRDAHPIPAEVYFVIEVADSSLEKDREFKRLLYAEANIPEYWIVNIPNRQIEVFRQAKDGDYQEQTIAKIGEQVASSTTEFVLVVEDLLGGFSE